jgi:hypothetical protein
MKKLISIIAGLFLISTLSACSSLSADSCGEGYYKSNGGNCIKSDMPPTWGTDEWVEPVDTSWIPSDFNSYAGDDNIAWKWADAVGGGYDCEYGDSCWALLVITRDGCPNGMYAELAIFDRNDIHEYIRYCTFHNISYNDHDILKDLVKEISYNPNDYIGNCVELVNEFYAEYNDLIWDVKLPIRSPQTPSPASRILSSTPYLVPAVSLGLSSSECTANTASGSTERTVEKAYTCN